jgi:hypothetical protein
MTSIGKKFNTGQIVVTRGIADLMMDNDFFRMFVHESLLRHTLGDWGDVGIDDKHQNEMALAEEERLFSVYQAKSLPKVWVITEADRSSTCVLFPNEY